MLIEELSLTEELAPLEASEVNIVKMYGLSRQRNAWHSTWVSNWLVRTMYTEYATARGAAERARTQGSQLRIREISSLAFVTDGGVLVVSHLNTSTPFRNWGKHDRRARENGKRVRAGATIRTISEAFSAQERWKRNTAWPRTSADLQVRLGWCKPTVQGFAGCSPPD